tara:strand:+ start:195 stop:548 length:354 start_codon:yes stop_codon:yes gene_type:complete
MERDIYDYDSKKYIDVRNQIMKDVDSLFLTLFRELYLDIPNFLEWEWGIQTSRGGYFEDYEFCELRFKQKNVNKKVQDWIFERLFPPKIRKLFLNEGLENHIDDFGYRWRKKESKEN